MSFKSARQGGRKGGVHDWDSVSVTPICQSLRTPFFANTDQKFARLVFRRAGGRRRRPQLAIGGRFASPIVPGRSRLPRPTTPLYATPAPSSHPKTRSDGATLLPRRAALAGAVSNQEVVKMPRVGGRKSAPRRWAVITAPRRWAVITAPSNSIDRRRAKRSTQLDPRMMWQACSALT